MRSFQDRIKEVTAKLVHERFPMDEETQRLVGLATWDLYNGPIVGHDDDGKPWPGFETATQRIADALDVHTVYMDMDSETLSDTLDEGHEDEETGEWVEPETEDVYEVDQSNVVSILVGKELAEYVR